MKYILIILFLSLIFFSAKSQSPTGLPTVNSPAAYYNIGWLRSDSGSIIATNPPTFTPRFFGTEVTYVNPGVDTSLWVWIGRWVKELKTGDIPNLTATLPIVYNAGNISCPTCGTGGGGITNLNTLTATTQTFATGTSGSDFNISSSGSVHTFNFPTASASNRGLLGTSDFTSFAAKQPQLNGTGFVKATGTTISYDNSTYYLASNPSNFTTLASFSALSPALYNNSTGVHSVDTTTGLTHVATQAYVLAHQASGTLTGASNLAPLFTTSVVSNTLVFTASNAGAHTYFGNNGGSPAGASFLTNTQVTADLNLFTNSLQGLVPASGGGTTNFLAANGTWIAPGGLIASVSNSDGTLTISPTTGAVVASLALGHANTWSGLQTFGTLTTTGNTIFSGLTSSGANDSVLTVDPTTGQLHRRSGVLNLFAGNLMTATGGDTLNAGGTALNNTTFAMGAFSLSITGLPNKSTALGTDSIPLIDLAGKLWKFPVPSGGSGGVTTVGAFSGSSQTNGASISTNTITFGPADATNPGMVKASGSQTFGSTITFNNAPILTTSSSVNQVWTATGTGGQGGWANNPGGAVSRNFLSDSIFQSASYRYRDTTLGIKYQFDYALAPVFVDSLHALTPITGYGYDSSNWVTIGTGSYLQTNSGYSVSGGKLVATGSSTYPNFIRLPFATKLDNWTGQLDYKITSLVTTDSGYKVRMVNTSGGTTAVLEAYLNTATGANFGKVALNSIQAGSASFEQYSSGAMATILANDSITVSLYYNFGVVIVTATDWTQLETVSTTYTNTYSSASGYAVTNTAQLTFNPGPSTYQVDHIKYSSNQPYRPSILVAGYSITDGFFAGSISADAYRVIGGSINAGTGDQTAQLILRVPEIEAQKPVSVLIGGIAGNDVAASVSSGVWQANLLGIYDSLTAHGISVYFTLESPRNSVDITAVNTYIKATFPGRWIDIYTPLWSGSGTGLNAAYSFDGTHWNAAGHALVAAVIDTSAQYLAMAAADPNLGVVKYYGKPHYTGADSLTHITYGDLVSYVASHASGVIQGGSRTDGAMMMQSGLNRIIASPLIIDSTGTSPTMTFRTTAGFKFFTNFAGSGDIPAGSAYQASTTNDLCFFADATGGAAGKGVHLLSLQNGGVQSWAEKLNVASGLGVTRFNKDGGYSQFNVLSTAPNTDAIIQMGLGNLAPITNGTDTLGTFQHQFAGLYAGYGNFTAALGAGKTSVATSFLSLAAATVGASSMNIAVSSFPPTSPGQGDVWATSGHLFYRDGSTSFDLINPSTPTLQQILTAGSTLTGANTIAQANNPLTFSSGAIVVSGAITGSAGNNSSQLTLSPATLTDNSSSGTVASKCDACFFSPTFAASTSTTYTNAATLYINGPPGAGTNVTNTNSWALQVGGGNSLIQGNLYSSHYLDNSPTPGIAAGTGAGTTPTVSIIGTDQSGQITVTTGTAPTLSGVIATITYASGFSFRTGTYPILFPGNSAAALLSGASMVFTTGSQTNFTITAGTSALLGATTYIFYYKVGAN